MRISDPFVGWHTFHRPQNFPQAPKTVPFPGSNFGEAGYRHDSASERNSFTAITGCDGGEAESSSIFQSLTAPTAKKKVDNACQSAYLSRMWVRPRVARSNALIETCFQTEVLTPFGTWTTMTWTTM